MKGMTLEKTWHEALGEELKKPYVAQLKGFLADEKASKQTVFPPEDLVFNAFRHTPYDKVKVVIMGQDPYHGPGQAEGLCFSVAKGVRIPPSLKNIYKEMQTDLGTPPADHGSLLKWADQGVLLLNATLTVRARQPKSHYGKGWEQFTDAVISALCDRPNPLVFVLWGRSAKEKCERILESRQHSHAVLTCAHPSPYSAENFFGCRHFSKINDYLKQWDKEPIDWSLNS